MNGAPSARGRDARHDRRDADFYVPRFYFYVYGGTRTDCLQHLFKRGKPDAGSYLEIVEVRKRNRRDSTAGDGRIDRRRKQRVVMDYNGSIACCVNVELDGIGTSIQCRFEGRKRILGVSVANATVGNYFRGRQLFFHWRRRMPDNHMR